MQESAPETAKIVARFLMAKRAGYRLEEVVLCGMGEPLLRYDCALDICRYTREIGKSGPIIRVDTSGLFWAFEQRLDILNWIDVLSVSLNAESAEKYEELCQPRIPRAYEVLMGLLKAVKEAETEKKQNLGFPKVRLSVVDTTEEEFVPTSGRILYEPGTFPRPDFDACREIAAAFGWPLVVKRLFRDSCDEIWSDPAIQEKCARGIQIERCRDCSYRH
jgi:TatD family-associated radical SAM protein